MATILITNDDGIDSPILLPLARALQRVGTVRTVVPDRERSWIAKAITRFDRLEARAAESHGLDVRTVSGTPADCVNLALFDLFPDHTDLVVSGINLGLNFGSAFLWSSGTVAAAIEARLAGVPAIAFSMALPHDAYGLSGDERAARLGDLPARAVAVAADITETIMRHPWPGGVDLFSVNMPATVQSHTPRRVTSIARTTYGALFRADGSNGYRHNIRKYEVTEAAPGSDIEVFNAGEVSIAPIRLDVNADVPEVLRTALERR